MRTHHTPSTPSTLQAFCAGGDVKDVVLAAREGRPSHGMRFFRAEYATDYRIATFPRPHIALLDGIVMGGGAGLSMHGHFRVATERCAGRRGWCGRGGAGRWDAATLRSVGACTGLLGRA